MIVTEYMENGSLDTFLKVRFEAYLIIQCYLYIDNDIEVKIELL